MRTRFADAAQHADAFFVIRAISTHLPLLTTHTTDSWLVARNRTNTSREILEVTTKIDSTRKWRKQSIPSKTRRNNRFISIGKAITISQQTYLTQIQTIVLAICLLSIHPLNYNNMIKGGESSSQFQWFTTAKIEL